MDNKGIYIDERYQVDTLYTGRIILETVDTDTYQAMVHLYDVTGAIVDDEFLEFGAYNTADALTNAENALEALRKGQRPNLRIVR